MIDFEKWRDVIKNYKVDRKSREEHAEVHTPERLTNKMLDELPEERFGGPLDNGNYNVTIEK